MFETLVGQVAVVTGASGGIGHAIVKKLLNYGVNVAAIYHKRKIEISKSEYGDNVTFFQYQAMFSQK